MKRKQSTDSRRRADRLEYLRNCLRGSNVALMVWNDLLTKEDKRKLGNNLEPQYRKHGTIGIWMKLRNLSQNAAIVDLAYRMDLIAGAEKDRMEEALGSGTVAVQAIDKPTWDGVCGRLYWGTTTIRIVKPAKRSNVRAILTAFEEQGWPAQTDDPLPGGSNPQRLHQAVLSLNKGLREIRFHVSAGGKKVYWVPTTQPTSNT